MNGTRPPMLTTQLAVAKEIMDRARVPVDSPYRAEVVSAMTAGYHENHGDFVDRDCLREAQGEGVDLTGWSACESVKFGRIEQTQVLVSAHGYAAWKLLQEQRDLQAAHAHTLAAACGDTPAAPAAEPQEPATWQRGALASIHSAGGAE